MQRNLIETLVGALVLAVAAGFAWYAVSSSGFRTPDGYEVWAQFDRVGGIAAGSDVRVSGIKVGTVSSVALDPKTYFAEVRIRLPTSIRVPTDSVAQITSEGLLGSNFLSIVPGNADQMLNPNDRIARAQGPVDLMQMLGRFIFSVGDQPQQGKPGSAAPIPMPPGAAGAVPQNAPPQGTGPQSMTPQAFPGAPERR